jgi:hypothetical protein
VADNGRRLAPLLPGDSTPSQDRLARLVGDGLAGKHGIFIGTRWRMIEEQYPADGPLCLVIQTRTKQGWVHAAVIGPDGTVTATAGTSTPTPEVYAAADRPAADADSWGTTIVVRDTGVDDSIQVCRMLAGGTYEWYTVA